MRCGVFDQLIRSQPEPEFIYVSSAGVPPFTDRNYEAEVVALQQSDPKAYCCAQGEQLLRKSGLAYTIVRVGGYNNAPGGVQALQVKQDNQDVGLIARADLADICVNCLLDPRACNVAFYASTSPYAPTASDPNQNGNVGLARMKPNT